MAKQTINLEGLYCRACELTIQKNLEELPEIKKARASFRKQVVEIIYDDMAPAGEKIKEAVERAGYQLGVGKKLPWLASTGRVYGDLLSAGLILFALYLLVRLIGLDNLNFSLGQSVSYPMLFLVGLVAGVSTCMVLVGGLVLGFAASHAENHATEKFSQKFRPHLFFNLGRIVGFLILGGVLGALGSILSPSARFYGALIILVSLVMLLLGVKLTEIFPRLSQWQLTLPKWLGGRMLNKTEYSPFKTFLGGVLTFFLPCGFTQAAQVLAVASGSFWAGGLFMFLFALGTAPGLLSLGALSAWFKGRAGQIFFKVAGLAVILFGAFNLSNGLILTGLKAATVDQKETITVGGQKIKIINGEQILEMNQLAFGYEPNKLVVKKGVPVKWVITSKNPYTCASSLVVPSLNLYQTLQAGKNIINFTPDKAGIISFSCSMGMYRGYIKVKE